MIITGARLLDSRLEKSFMSREGDQVSFELVVPRVDGKSMNE